ncbi:MAG: PHP domain-containing protein [Lachnospiraceae bacterium]|nr:PHP domain-containing protein [Lachnospiraceae bacterium]
MEKYKVDLHIHSSHSDGTFTPQQLIDIARNRNIKCISITDHDTLAGVDEVMKSCNLGEIKFIPGVELSCGDGEYSYHILAYNFDVNNTGFRTLVDDEANQLGRKKMEDMIRFVDEECGFPISGKEKDKIMAKSSPRKLDLARTMYKLKYGIDIETIIKVTLNEFGEFEDENKYQLDVKRAIDTIHKAGGIAIWAHPYRAKNRTVGKEEFLRRYERLEGKIDGMEAFYSYYSKDQYEFLEQFAKDKNMLVSAGSDFHGQDRPNRPFGVINAEEEYISSERITVLDAIKISDNYICENGTPPGKKKVIVISGFSGSGKGTVVKELLTRNKNVKLVRSLTTRKPRKGETDEYTFVSTEEFLKIQNSGGLLEHNMYDGNMYGTPIKDVQEILDNNMIPVLEIDPTGFLNVKDNLAMSKYEITGFFMYVVPDELLARLEMRKSESYESIIRRLKTAKNELIKLHLYDYVLENYNTEFTVNRIEDFIKKGEKPVSYNFKENLFICDIDRIISQLNDTDSINSLKKRVARFTEIRDWTQYHTIKDIAIGITNESAELLQIFRFKTEEQIADLLNNPETQEHIREEVGDILFFILDFANHTGLDLGQCLLEKLDKNDEKYPIGKENK